MREWTQRLKLFVQLFTPCKETVPPTYYLPLCRWRLERHFLTHIVEFHKEKEFHPMAIQWEPLEVMYFPSVIFFP